MLRTSEQHNLSLEEIEDHDCTYVLLDDDWLGFLDGYLDVLDDFDRIRVRDLDRYLVGLWHRYFDLLGHLERYGVWNRYS